MNLAMNRLLGAAVGDILEAILDHLWVVWLLHHLLLKL
jgi:hypothetical protein